MYQKFLKRVEKGCIAAMQRKMFINALLAHLVALSDNIPLCIQNRIYKLFSLFFPSLLKNKQERKNNLIVSMSIFVQ